MVDEMVASGIDDSRIHVSGIPVRRAFFRDAIEEYSLEEPVKVLVMGGGLGLGSLETALKHLDEVNGIDEITVVAGQNTSLYESLVTLSESMRRRPPYMDILRIFRSS